MGKGSSTAKDMASSLTGISGQPATKTNAWIANLEGRARDLKNGIANEIEIATLNHEQRIENVTLGGTIIMGDHIENYGQVGAIGSNSKGVVQGGVVSWNNRNLDDIDFQRLVEELKTFRKALRQQAETLEHDEIVLTAGLAQRDAENGNKEGALKQLSRLGNVGTQLAKELGLNLLSELILKVSGLK
jgi:hypothetical protein